MEAGEAEVRSPPRFTTIRHSSVCPPCRDPDLREAPSRTDRHRHRYCCLLMRPFRWDLFPRRRRRTLRTIQLPLLLPRQPLRLRLLLPVLLVLRGALLQPLPPSPPRAALCTTRRARPSLRRYPWFLPLPPPLDCPPTSAWVRGAQLNHLNRPSPRSGPRPTSSGPLHPSQRTTPPPSLEPWLPRGPVLTLRSTSISIRIRGPPPRPIRSTLPCSRPICPPAGADRRTWRALCRHGGPADPCRATL